jgi:hypothetical protein
MAPGDEAPPSRHSRAWLRRVTHPRFLSVVSTLDPKLTDLLACAPLRFGQLPTNMVTAGVYMFSEKGRDLYVGRSNRLRARYFLHCRPGSQQNQASFAYRLARERLGITRASYMPGAGSRAGIAATETFVEAFSVAKARIRDMEYRYVEETDQTRQALLEAYCAIVLETPYNDFDTH